MRQLNRTSDLWHVRLSQKNTFEVGPLCCWEWLCWW